MRTVSGARLTMVFDSPFRIPGRSLGLFLLLLGVCFGSPPRAQAQPQRTVGIHVGQVRAHQVWRAPASTSDVTGFTIGVNVDVPTPLPGLWVRAGAGYWGRGSKVSFPEAEPGSESAGEVKSHFLGFTIQGKLGAAFGPAMIYLAAGPILEQLLDTRCSPELCGVLVEEQPTALGITAGPGLSVTLPGGLRAEGEAMFTEGLTETYRLPAYGTRYRSLEFLFRIAIPF